MEGSQSSAILQVEKSRPQEGEGPAELTPTLNDLLFSIPCDLSHRTWGWSLVVCPHKSRIERSLLEHLLRVGRLMQRKDLGLRVGLPPLYPFLS